jgi:hypothetical protein
MAEPVPDSKTPALVALAFIAIGIVLGVVKHAVWGGVIAGFGVIPACVGMWKGIQQQTQTTLAISIGAVIASLAAGAALIALGLLSYL